MPDEPFPHLFAPGRIGRLAIANRTVQLPMGTRMAHDGKVTARDVEFHRERAAGGVGLVIVGGTLAHVTSVYRGRVNVEAYDPATVEGMAARARAIKAHGVPALVQLNHFGRDMHGQADHAPVAPSAVASPRDRVVPRALSADDLRMLVDAYGRSAEHVRAAGYDGVEIQAANGYLMAQFLSAAANRRDDAYGGDLRTGRVRLLAEALTEVRARGGDGFVVGVRLSAQEDDPGGLELEDTLVVAERLQELGLVDYLSITVGMRSSYVKDGAFAEGFALPLAAAVRRVVDVPVIAAGRIRNPAVAERALADGSADFVGLARALLADPAWPRKAERGAIERIRPCVGFVQDCRLSLGGVTCAVNPRAGREVEWGAGPARADGRERLVVVGGGPGGLEAARLAAETGRSVVLFERDQRLGGQLLLAARGPTRHELADLVAHLEHEVRRLGVDLRLGVEADAGAVLAEEPDAVVVAAGARPGPPDFPVSGGARVVDVHALLAGDSAPPGRRALVVDDGSGFWHGISAAEWLLARGLAVELVTPARAVGLAIPHESVAGVHRRLRSAGALFRTLCGVRAVDGTAVRLADVVTGEEAATTADVVVAVPWLAAQDGLVDALRGRVPALAAVGDCVAPRRLTHALLDANLAVLRLSQGALTAAALPLS